MKSLHVPQLSRQAERSATTRAALLEAAEQIFARDGFEAASIEDIALAADRSRGAFYANFESKAELFLALHEQMARKRAIEIRETIQDLADPAAQDHAVKAYLVNETLNERQLLLEIEFKLFAVRRPEMLKALAAKHLEARSRINQEELAPHLPEWRCANEVIGRNTLAIEAILEGLALNHLFHSRVLTSDGIAVLLPELIDTIMQSSALAEGEAPIPCGDTLS